MTFSFHLKRPGLIALLLTLQFGVLLFTDALQLTSLGSSIVGQRDKSEADTQEDASNLAAPACPPPDGSSSDTLCQQMYGVDKSFPIQHNQIDDDDGTPSPFNARERQREYNEFLSECRENTRPLEHLCDESETDRIHNNLVQPSMMKNYTSIGFKKIKTPPKLNEYLANFWWTNSGLSARNEQYIPGSTIINHWRSNTRVMDIDDAYFIGSGGHLRTIIWEESQSILEEWSGVELTPSALYGIRIFGREAVIPPQLDPLPLVISAIIHVEDVLYEPWPIEVYGHDGKAYNVTLERGEMLLYEGNSVIVGRPYPMKGMFFSDVFAHFEPLELYLDEQQLQQSTTEDDLENLYQQALVAEKRKTAEAADANIAAVKQATLVPYYIDDAMHEKRWKQTHPHAKLKITKESITISAHTAAAAGDLEALKVLEAATPGVITMLDENGWNTLHEAVRGGQIAVIKYLLKRGLDINTRTHHGEGGSALWWAKHVHGKNHKVVRFLELRGAKEIPPDDDK